MAKSNTIYLSKEAYMFLNDKSRLERGCEKLSEKAKDKMWNRAVKYNGKIQMFDGGLGGGDGTQNYHNWTSWSLIQIKKMLKAAGYDWVDGETVEYIDI